MSGTWGCPHEVNNACSRVNDLPCDPGMKGCVLAGRYFFFGSDEKNERLRRMGPQDEDVAANGAPDDVAGDDVGQ